MYVEGKREKMLCNKNSERFCERGLCKDYDLETEECAYRKFPLWMGQLADNLKHNSRLSQFKTLTELAERFLKISVR